VTVVLLGRDLIVGSKVLDAAARAGVAARQAADPSELPDPSSVKLLVVDWGDRRPDWGDRIARWCAGAPESVRPSVLVFGPHRDLEAHAAARASGLGPMRARSSLIAEIAKRLGLTADGLAD